MYTEPLTNVLNETKVLYMSNYFKSEVYIYIYLLGHGIAGKSSLTGK